MTAENVAYGLRQADEQGGGRSPGQRGAGDGQDDQARQAQAAADVGRTAAAGGARLSLVNKPSVLLLDEPLGALDRKLRQEMQIELKLLQNQLGITFVFVTHDQEEALSMSDRIAVMLDGRVEQLGGPNEIYEHLPSGSSDSSAEQFLDGILSGDGQLTRTASPSSPDTKAPAPCRASPASPPCVPKRSRSPATNRRPGRTS